MASKEAKVVDKRVRATQDNADPNQVVLPVGADGKVRERTELENVPLRDPKTTDEQFPTSGFVNRRNERDEVMTAKLALQNEEALPGVTPFGMLIAKDSDFKWLQEKREQEEYANFQLWFAQNFDKMSPEQKKIARELFPQFYSERLQQLKRTVDLQARIARLKLMGIQNRDDLLLQYAIESGYIDSDPLEAILHPERNAGIPEANYVRGIFNPRRLLKGDWGLSPRKHNASAILGRQPERIGNTFDSGTGNVGFALNENLSSNTEDAAWQGKAGAKSIYSGLRSNM